ncbi:MAG: hypothetical protein J6V58_00880 [Clostridia bacterium]|nr:hypothetical protein [Clostridia bacterium]
MSLFSNCGCGEGNDTILWFIILFLLIFCGNGFGCGTSNNNCGCNECC